MRTNSAERLLSRESVASLSRMRYAIPPDNAAIPAEVQRQRFDFLLLTLGLFKRDRQET